MTTRFAFVLFALLGVAANPALAGPEEDRVGLVHSFEQRFPGLALDDYVLGAFMLNRASRSHYEDIMAFPPFLGDIERGKTSFAALEKLVLSRLGDPSPRSGQQEYLENLLTRYLHG